MKEHPKTIENSEKNQRYLRIICVCLVFLTGSAAALALAKLKAVIVPLVLALLFYALLLPAAGLLKRRLKVPIVLGKLLSLTVGICILALIFYGFSISLDGFLTNFSMYKEKTLSLIDSYEDSGIATYAGSLRDWDGESISRWAGSFSLGAVGVLGNLGLVMVFFLFLIFSPQDPNSLGGVIEKIQVRISTYMVIKSMVSLTTALLTGIFFAWMGLEMALTFALAAFVLNFIPNLGSVFATLLPVPVAFLQFGFSPELTAIFLVPGLFQVFIGNFIEPKLMGNSFGMHPIAILSCLVFWSILWGWIGLFLAVPMTVAIKIICHEVKELRIINRILEGQFKKTGIKKAPVLKEAEVGG